uniref:Retrovirus-related Pol polyprotein from transposon TNT 1-94-like beta-barrel domain-containing protein n=1 Tax=Physcomitrium patens TaxID=3218 RepID=A0A7I3YZM0_PHYPA
PHLNTNSLAFGVNLAEEFFVEPHSQNLHSNKVKLDPLEFLTLSNSNNQNNNWILDSSTSRHYSGDYPAFSALDHSNSATVTSTRGYSHVIARQGLIDLSLSNGEIKSFKDICCVLGLHRNILLIE